MPQYCPSVCPSVTFRYRDHICWNTSKIISPPNSDKIVIWRFLRNRRLLLCLHTIFRALIYWAHRAVVLAIAWHLVTINHDFNLPRCLRPYTRFCCIRSIRQVALSVKCKWAWSQGSQNKCFNWINGENRHRLFNWLMIMMITTEHIYEKTESKITFGVSGASLRVWTMLSQPDEQYADDSGTGHHMWYSDGELELGTANIWLFIGRQYVAKACVFLCHQCHILSPYTAYCLDQTGAVPGGPLAGPDSA